MLTLTFHWWFRFKTQIVVYAECFNMQGKNTTLIESHLWWLNLKRRIFARSLRAKMHAFISSKNLCHFSVLINNEWLELYMFTDRICWENETKPAPGDFVPHYETSLQPFQVRGNRSAQILLRRRFLLYRLDQVVFYFRATDFYIHPSSTDYKTGRYKAEHSEKIHRFGLWQLCWIDGQKKRGLV